jgi:hypothetical protein
MEFTGQLGTNESILGDIILGGLPEQTPPQPLPPSPPTPVALGSGPVHAAMLRAMELRRAFEQAIEPELVSPEPAGPLGTAEAALADARNLHENLVGEHHSSGTLESELRQARERHMQVADLRYKAQSVIREPSKVPLQVRNALQRARMLHQRFSK